MSGKTETKDVAQTSEEQNGTTVDTTDQKTGANSAPETKKVNRRGISAARGTQRLRFSHEIAKPNGLFIGHLNSVEVSNILIGEDTTGMPSFNGLEIPRLTLTFASNEDEVIKRHFQTIQFSAVESTVKTIPGGDDEWKVNQIFDWMKHILNVFILKGRELTDAEADALSLPFEDFDDNGEYSPIEPETVIAGWKTLFENFENMLNRGADGKPAFKTKEGKIIALWLKLIRYTKHNKKGWIPVSNGELSFPTFVGEGAIEVFKQNVNPSLRLNIVKEGILPRNDVEKAKSPNMAGNGIPSIGGIPGDGMGNFGGPVGGFGGLNSETADDMPF